MSKPQTSRPVTVYFDSELWTAFKDFCGKNPKVKSPSAELVKMMRSVISKRGRRFNLRVPAHLVSK